MKVGGGGGWTILTTTSVWFSTPTVRLTPRRYNQLTSHEIQMIIKNRNTEYETPQDSIWFHDNLLCHLQVEL